MQGLEYWKAFLHVPAPLPACGRMCLPVEQRSLSTLLQSLSGKPLLHVTQWGLVLGVGVRGSQFLNSSLGLWKTLCIWASWLGISWCFCSSSQWWSLAVMCLLGVQDRRELSASPLVGQIFWAESFLFFLQRQMGVGSTTSPEALHLCLGPGSWRLSPTSSWGRWFVLVNREGSRDTGRSLSGSRSAPTWLQCPQTELLQDLLPAVSLVSNCWRPGKKSHKWVQTLLLAGSFEHYKFITSPKETKNSLRFQLFSSYLLFIGHLFLSHSLKDMFVCSVHFQRGLSLFEIEFNWLLCDLSNLSNSGAAVVLYILCLFPFVRMEATFPYSCLHPM